MKKDDSKSRLEAVARLAPERITYEEIMERWTKLQADISVKPTASAGGQITQIEGGNPEA